MGCDIHGFIEVNIGFGWEFRIKVKMVRDYPLFCLIGGVRRDEIRYFVPIVFSHGRGFPDNVNNRGQRMKHWDVDGHSHSWFDWDDLEEIYDNPITEKIIGRFEENKKILDKVKHYGNKYGKDRVRMVFWFDN